jgi:predicted ester cyclase
MDKETTVRECFAAFEAAQTEKAGGYFADSFVLTGPTPQPIGKKEFVGLQTALIRAFPDWKFNIHNYHTQGDIVTLELQITGTHTHTLASLMPGVPEVPATGKHISLPLEHCQATVKDGKITTFSTDAGPDGGVMGLFQQIGVPIGG